MGSVKKLVKKIVPKEVRKPVQRVVKNVVVRPATQVVKQAARTGQQAERATKRVVNNALVRPIAQGMKLVGLKGAANALQTGNPIRNLAGLAAGTTNPFAASSIPGLKEPFQNITRGGLQDVQRVTGAKVPTDLMNNPNRYIRGAGAAIGLGGLAAGGGAGLFGAKGVPVSEQMARIGMDPSAMASSYPGGAISDVPTIGGGDLFTYPGLSINTGVQAGGQLSALQPVAAPAAAGGGGGAAGGIGWGKVAGYGGLGLLGLSLLKGMNQKQPSYRDEELPADAYVDPSMFASAGGVGGTEYQYVDDLAGQQADISSELYDWYKANTQPLQEDLINNARVGLDPNYYADAASANVTGAFNSAQQQQQRQLSRLGINPASPMYQDSTYDMQLARAAADAGARNDARMWTNDTNYTRQANAASIGAGYPSLALSGLGNAASTYGGLMDQQLAADQLAASIAQGNARTAYNYYLNQQNQQAQQDQLNQQQQSDFWGSVGSIGGTLFGRWLFS